MNYLVTGGAGFIGSNYVRMLLSDQLGRIDSVKVLDKLTYAGSLNNLSSVWSDSRLSFINGDICDEEIVSTSLDDVDVIVHFAAETHVDRSITGPSEFIRTNVLGTQVLLSFAVVKNVKVFIHVSTDEVYGSVDKGSSLESDGLFPNSPYSASKAASDLLVRSYVQTYGIDARITRCCNNYGPNQFPEKLIPLSIKKLKEGSRIPIYGDGSNVREWIHINDHCKGIQKVIEAGSRGEVYNIGSGIHLSNLQLIRMLLSVSGQNTNQFDFVMDRKGHDFRYSLDFAKLRSMGFTTHESLEDTLRTLWEEE